MSTTDDETLLSQDLPALKTVRVQSAVFPNGEGVLEFRETGEKDSPALLLMHGIGSNSAGYRAQLAGLRDKFRVIAWNAPGYGDSTHLADDVPHYSAYVEAASSLLRALDIKKLSGVVGSSWGSVVATCFVQGSSFPVKSLVLSAPNVARKTPQCADALNVARLATIASGLSSFGQHRVAIANRLLAPDASTSARAHTLLLRDAVNQQGWTQAMSMLFTVSTPELLRDIRANVSVIVGSKDAVAPESLHAEVLRAARPELTYHRLEGIGHMPKLEAPTTFNRIVEESVLGRT